MFDDLNGSLISSNAAFTRQGLPRKLINPATEEPFREVFDATADDVNGAAKSALTAWEGGWRDLPPRRARGFAA